VPFPVTAIEGHSKSSGNQRCYPGHPLTVRTADKDHIRIEMLPFVVIGRRIVEMNVRGVRERQVGDVAATVAAEVVNVCRPRRPHIVIVNQRIHEPGREVSLVPWIVGEKVDPSNAQAAQRLHGLGVNGRDAGGDHTCGPALAAGRHHAPTERGHVRRPPPAPTPIDRPPKSRARIRRCCVTQSRVDPQGVSGLQQMTAHVHFVGIADNDDALRGQDPTTDRYACAIPQAARSTL